MLGAPTNRDIGASSTPAQQASGAHLGKGASSGVCAGFDFFPRGRSSHLVLVSCELPVPSSERDADQAAAAARHAASSAQAALLNSTLGDLVQLLKKDRN